MKHIVNDFTKNQQWLNIVITNSLGNFVIDSMNDGTGEEIVSKLTEEELNLIAKFHTESERVYIKDGMLYYIEKLNDDIIVRTSFQLEDNTEYILISIFYMLLLIIGVFLATIFLSKKTSDRITDAFEKIISNLKLINDGTHQQIDTHHRYDEVSEALEEINKNIYNHIVIYERERDKINFIINNVRQGIVVIDENYNLMFINHYALKVLHIETKPILDEKFHKTLKNDRIINAIYNVFENQMNKHIDYYDDTSDKIYDFRLSYQNHEWNNGHKRIGMIFIIITDITEKRKEDDSRAEFIANASHELKTPITTISGFSELILNGYGSCDQAAFDYIQKIHSESIQMKDTINELLYLSNLEWKGKNIQAFEMICLNYLCQDVISSYINEARKKQVALNFTASEECYIEGIESLIMHLISNLVENAIKYNKENGNVNVSIINTEKTVEIIVQDTGIGMTESQQTKIFERFYRAEESRNRTAGGTGLGLPIAKKICYVHDAKISVHSKFEEGSEFKVIFYRKIKS